MVASLDDFIKKYDTQATGQPQPQESAQTSQQGFNPDMGALADPGMVGAAGEMVMAPLAIAGYPLGKATEAAGKGLNYLGGPFSFRPEISFGNMVRRGFGQPEKPGEQAPTTGEMMAEAGSWLAVPGLAKVTGKIASNVARAVTDKFPRWLVESALKIPPSVPEDVRQMSVGKVLEGNIPTVKTLNKMIKDRKTNYAEVKRLIDEGTQAGKTVDVDTVLSKLENVKNDYANMDIPQPYIDRIDEYAAQFKDARGDTLTLQQAQDMKKKLYKMTQDDWKPQKISSLQKDMWKEVSLGLKEGLEAEYPQLKTLNKADADYKNFMVILERAIHRIRNYDVIRMGDVISASAGAAAEGPAGLGIGYTVKRIIEAPLVKSKLAHLLKKTEGKGLGLTQPSRIGAGLGAAQLQSITSEEDYNNKFSKPSVPGLDEFIKKYGEQ